MEFKKIKLPFKIKKPILALGSHTKNTVCFAKGSFAYLSPVHNNLSDPEDFLAFTKAVKYFLKKDPKVIAYDLHPEYQSSKFAAQLSTVNCQLSTIQHHHAHIASCMLENGLKNQKVIGAAFDGTGLGTDTTLWGAEFLICDYKDFQRKAHLREIPLLGAERAILEPWRLTAIWLYLIYKDKFLNLKINFAKGLDKKKWRVLKKMYLSEFNSPQASSMGRLFDAASSLILGKYKVNFEAQLPIELEKIAGYNRQEAKSYRFRITKNKDKYILDPLPMFRQIVLDLKSRASKEKMAYRFHLTVAQMIREMCLRLRKETNINKVVLSGGVFQNKLLLRLNSDLLYKEGFDIFTQRNLSCSDSGISLGQIAVANFRS